MHLRSGEHFAMGVVQETIRATISGFVLQLVLPLYSRIVHQNAIYP